MTESETLVVVRAEEEQLNQFVEGLIVDPQESTLGKSHAHKKRKTGEGSSKDVQSGSSSATRAPPPPPTRRPRPFQEQSDRLSKETGSYSAK
ncbi:hypothetical protein Hanom_Chr05g00409651 [Helianthus anomalus]